MVTILAALACLLALVAALQWWQIHDLGRDLKQAQAGWEKTLDVCESYLELLRRLDLVNSVDTCERRRP